MASNLPLPPDALAARIGTPDGEDPLAFYRNEGARLRAVIEGLLPSDWSWKGKEFLDFGCGSARVLRQFEDEAHDASFVGCDIDAATIAWNQANLSPPFRFLHSGLTPPLPLEPSSMNLVWAMSVFTHVADSWADWLLELHRLLVP
jgi:SAM-dependent methyltransferase